MKLELDKSWSSKLAEIAETEGWNLYYCSTSGDGIVQAQRNNDDGILKTEKDAWKIIANGNKSHHITARGILKIDNPQEYNRVMEMKNGLQKYEWRLDGDSISLNCDYGTVTADNPQDALEKAKNELAINIHKMNMKLGDDYNIAVNPDSIIIELSKYDWNNRTIAETRLMVDEELYTIVNKIGIDRIHNYQEILEFILNDIMETTTPDVANSEDAKIGFHRWIEAQSDNQP